jgi:hypothetical protein
LNLSVPSFGLVEHLTDEIDWALNTISVVGLLVLDHQDSGDDSISRSNIELKDESETTWFGDGGPLIRPAEVDFSV